MNTKGESKFLEFLIRNPKKTLYYEIKQRDSYLKDQFCKNHNL